MLLKIYKQSAVVLVALCSGVYVADIAGQASSSPPLIALCGVDLKLNPQ